MSLYDGKSFANKPQIKTVNGLRLNDLVMFEGNLFKVTYFPTRDMVCGALVHEITGSAPNNFKMPRRDVDCRFNDMVETFI